MLNIIFALDPTQIKNRVKNVHVFCPDMKQYLKLAKSNNVQIFVYPENKTASYILNNRKSLQVVHLKRHTASPFIIQSK